MSKKRKTSTKKARTSAPKSRSTSRKKVTKKKPARKGPTRKKSRPTKEYFSNQYARFNDEDAMVIGPELERLSREGKDSPEDVIEAARSKRNPLNGYFEWDDSKAAEKYRISQANYMIRHIEIEIRIDNSIQRTRAFHHVDIEIIGANDDTERDRKFVPLSVIEQDEAMALQLVNRCLVELRNLQNRYSQYRSYFGKVFQAIDKLPDRF